MRKFRPLALVLAVVGSLLLVPAITSPASAATTTYQAENAARSQGVVESNHAGYTGTGFVNYDNVTGSSVTFTVNVGTAGSAALAFRYSNGTTVSRPMTIAVDGSTVATPQFAGTSVWTTWKTTTVNTNLSAGSHTIKATATTANGGPNLDSLTVTDSGGGSGGAPTAAELLAKVSTCSQISNGTYKTDEELGRTIPVCGKNGAVFWKADMDIDCDGIRTSQCNENTDCCFLPDTAFHTSSDQPLNAAQLPYVVVPSPSSTWDYRNFQIDGGGVVAVIYNNQVTYAVVGDTGPEDIIGEASYAAANQLGINPDPSNGGTDSGVTYIVFKNSTINPIEDHNLAVSRGQELARTFIDNN
ncbi:carbohydrate binding protein with CBM6 domain [Kribbella voronezhensis]|uniref:Carbohydrate binding protein with CBM6 domain n=1 Tax=Kribbella voronezhensis TaxID=2512212 RepID=A0A4V6Q5Y1_9ACTN|nr:glycoside hydrolase family 75 protein [Kribbella voronezhensis]TDU89923.1 carbohydrate binding protein with CBM6 domain [Kribbella voronezhensis]